IVAVMDSTSAYVLNADAVPVTAEAIFISGHGAPSVKVRGTNPVMTDATGRAAFTDLSISGSVGDSVAVRFSAPGMSSDSTRGILITSNGTEPAGARRPPGPGARPAPLPARGAKTRLSLSLVHDLPADDRHDDVGVADGRRGNSRQVVIDERQVGQHA